MTDTNSPAVRGDIVDSIWKLLKGSTPASPVHWGDFIKELVDPNKCTNDELVAAMNSVIMPFGNVSGINHRFFIGLPS